MPLSKSTGSEPKQLRRYAINVNAAMFLVSLAAMMIMYKVAPDNEFMLGGMLGIVLAFANSMAQVIGHQFGGSQRDG